MTNKNKFNNFINTLSDYKNSIPEKYSKYYNNITSLYKKRIIESKATVEKMLKTMSNKRTYKTTPKKIQNIIDFVQSTKHRRPENGQKIKFVPLAHHEPVEGIKEKNQMRDFFLTADIKRYVSWKKTKKVDGKFRSVWTKWFDEANIRTKKGDGQIKEEKLIRARNLKEAKKIFYEELLDEKEADDSEARYRVHTLNFQYVDTKNFKREETKNMRLKKGRSYHYDYQLVKEEKTHLESGIDGFCVIDNLVGVYGPLIKGLDSKEKIINLCTDYYKNYDSSKFNPKDGISASCIYHICHLFQISHYAYDINSECFLKYIVKHRNYPTLCYYAIDNHMYLVKKDKVKSLVEKAKEKTKTINTSALEEKERINIFTTMNMFGPKRYNRCSDTRFLTPMNMFENIDVQDFEKYESCIFIYSRKCQDINDILKKVIEEYRMIPTNIRSNKTKVTYFEVEINDVKYICVLDPNHGADMNYKRIQELCLKHDIEFKNQTFTRFVKELRFKREEAKFERPTFDAEQRTELLSKVNYKCQGCSKPIELGEFDIDHIRPLSNGGTNDPSNLQSLCKACHKDKTKM